MTLLEQIAAWGALGTPRSEVEVMVGHALAADELSAFVKGRNRWRITRAQEAKRRKAAAAAKRQAEAEEALRKRLEGTAWPEPGANAPLSSTDRSRKHREAGRELGNIPRPRHLRVRESCRYNLRRFGMLYCYGPNRLLHHAPSPRMESFVVALQETILSGGDRHVRWPRGKGKTTWLKIAAIWALVYGHRRFILFVAAVRPLAEAATKEVWEALAEYPTLAVDFPEISVPLADVAMTPQRMRLQMYRGKRTGIEDTSARAGHRRLAALEGYPNTGGIIAARGADQKIRGLNIKSMRPDFIFIDDPQTGAETEGVLNKIEKNIQNTILNLGTTDKRTAAVMASTPVKPDDISERFADAERNPAWITTTEKLVVSWGDEDMIKAYFAQKRKGEKIAREWYVKNRKTIEAGSEMFDPADGDRQTQVSAYQYALDKLYEIGETAFFAEYQMRPPTSAFAFVISQKLILSRVRKGVAPFSVPPDSVLVTVATDINPSYGLTTTITAYNIALAGLVVGYKVAPCSISTKLPDPVFDSRLQEALAAHGRELAALGIKIDVWGIDTNGDQWRAVQAFRRVSASICGLECIPMLGRADTIFNPFVRSRIRSAMHDTVLCGDSRKDERWLAWNSDIYKERSQKGWGAEIGAPGSLSLFDGGVDHREFASQVSAEKLKSKKPRADGKTVYKWEGETLKHDFGDTVPMCLALAAHLGLTGDGSYVAESEAEDDVVFL